MAACRYKLVVSAPAMVPTRVRGPRRVLSVAAGVCRRHSSLRQWVPGQGWREVPLGASSTAPSIRDACRREQPLQARLGELLRQMLLPEGYPDTVSKNYLRCVSWTALGLLTGRIQAVLATQAALFAIGLGAGAIPMAAAIQWVLKDGVGHLSGIVYATMIKVQFDADAKRYRFHSTVALTIADFISILMPLVPQHFMLLASISSALHSVANVAQLSARARIHASFARRGNLGDIARAGQTQAKIVSLLGTTLGAWLSWIIGPSPWLVAACMLPLAGVSLGSIYTASRYVVLNTLNLQRAELVFMAMLDTVRLPEPGPGSEPSTGAATFHVTAPTPEVIARSEAIIFRPRPLYSRDLVLQPFLGRPRFRPFFLPTKYVDVEAALPLLPESAQNLGSSAWAATWHANGSYAIALRQLPTSATGGSPSAVVLWYGPAVEPCLKLQAMWHTCVLRHFLPVHTAHTTHDIQALDTLAAESWPHALRALGDAGWAVDRVYLDGYGACLHVGGTKDEAKGSEATT